MLSRRPPVPMISLTTLMNRSGKTWESSPDGEGMFLDHLNSACGMVKLGTGRGDLRNART